MSDTKIEWTDKTWNPITGCTKISEGCRNCYAEPMAKRLQAMGQIKYTHGFEKVVCHEKALEEPLKWKKPCKIFVCSMSDLFHDDVPFDFILRIYDRMMQCPQHTFMVLTKRPERAMEFYSRYGINGENNEVPKNVWLGVTAENQEQADKRIPMLLQIPAAKRFVSIEPMVGPVNLRGFIPISMTTCNACGFLVGHDLDVGGVACRGLDWVIVGGESGKNARPMHPDWVRSLREQCTEAGTPFFFKQWGEWKSEYKEGTKIEMENLKDNQAVAMGDGKTNHVLYTRVGKKKAGSLLDGIEHKEIPSEGK